ncbi:ribbon-helix-helix domain-containing protein [Helicobacter sp. WB40]|uniref:ribbon-helix-helix domain-containing protein n=1 Tax=Helicobacter sp. WB40 TaxID=3004130 RepID=UPI0022EBCD21|nr:ribbon-helix-helix domain-containing protein [Helicobacter sp. WB40]MDA3966642.1 ribbon-helix-helix domain-containing protein [Helicobacter sp. WB40]
MKKKRKKVRSVFTKEHSSPFSLTDEELELIAMLADFSGVSRSAVVERALRMRIYGGNEDGFKKAKAFQKAKKIQTKKSNNKKPTQIFKERAYIKESIFETCLA